MKLFKFEDDPRPEGYQCHPQCMLSEGHGGGRCITGLTIRKKKSKAAKPKKIKAKTKA
jgi:hypothetical protein